VFACDRYKDRGFDKVCEGIKIEKKKTLWIKIRERNLFLIKQQVKIRVSIKVT
jgi:hypothetical protein